MSEAKKDSERRRYFRIDDEVIFAFHPLDAAEKEALEARIKKGEDLCPDSYHTFVQLESEIMDLVRSNKNANPALSSAVELLNRKLNLFSKGPPSKNAEGSIFNGTPELVNLSGCGIGFLSSKPLEVGTVVEIQMVLLPAQTYVGCVATVANCYKGHIDPTKEPNPQKPYRVGVTFNAIRSEDSEKIIQHVIKKEVETLRDSKRHLKG